LTRPLLGLSAEASLHRARGARWHSSYVVGSRSPDPQFALQTTGAPDITDFHRGSFGPSWPAQHAGDTPFGGATAAAADFPRPSAEEASPDNPDLWRPLSLDQAGKGALHARFHWDPTLPGFGFVIVGLAPRQTRTQDAFRWLDLRPCDRSRLARAPFNVRLRSPCTLSPTANRPLSFLEDRRVKLTLAGATSLSTRFALPGRCVYPASATDLQTEHSIDLPVLESPSPSAFAGDDSFHAARPAETLARA